jgi:hypothetical protein
MLRSGISLISEEQVRLITVPAILARFIAARTTRFHCIALYLHVSVLLFNQEGTSKCHCRLVWSREVMVTE